MSFEGYFQIICENDHYSTSDVYVFDEDTFHCFVCRAKAKEYNMVDETNCESYGLKEVTLVTPAEYTECNLGHQHVTKEATYKLGKYCKPKE